MKSDKIINALKANKIEFEYYPEDSLTDEGISFVVKEKEFDFQFAQDGDIILGQWDEQEETHTTIDVMRSIPKALFHISKLIS